MPNHVKDIPLSEVLQSEAWKEWGRDFLISPGAVTWKLVGTSLPGGQSWQLLKEVTLATTQL